MNINNYFNNDNYNDNNNDCSNDNYNGNNNDNNNNNNNDNNNDNNDGNNNDNNNGNNIDLLRYNPALTDVWYNYVTIIFVGGLHHSSPCHRLLVQRPCS